MIYQTITEAIEACKNTGVLDHQSLNYEKYAYTKLGFHPHCLGMLARG